MSFDVQDFQSQVIQRSYAIPVLVDFWAEWCAPCRMLGPALERLAANNKGKWELAKVNTEELTDVAIEYHIQSIPNVKLFSQGKVVGEFVGALPEPMVAQWLENHIPGKHQYEIEGAKKLIEKEQPAEARALLEAVLAEEPDNKECKVYLAKTYLFESPERALALLKDIDDPKYSEITGPVMTITRLFEIAAKPESLPESEVKANYLSAIEKVRVQDFDAALSMFIEVIRAERMYDDDGSRKACIAIFKYLGEEHPTTIHHRKEFSRALY